MRLSGVGVDLVDLGRVSRFLKTHGKKSAGRVLTPGERAKWKKTSLSPVFFAKMFAAKEAFFKALGRAWMGDGGFLTMEVNCLPGKKFRVRALDGKKNAPEAEGTFFHRDGWLGAQVILWQN